MNFTPLCLIDMTVDKKKALSAILYFMKNCDAHVHYTCLSLECFKNYTCISYWGRGKSPAAGQRSQISRRQGGRDWDEATLIVSKATFLLPLALSVCIQ